MEEETEHITVKKIKYPDLNKYYISKDGRVF